jgi:diguanylate cyclase (GGDEF)-like protein/PAS domain S-box-containing protein
MHGLPLSSIAELLDILPDAVLMIDGHDRIVYGNPAVRSLLGYAPSDLTGEPLSVLLPPAVRARHAALVAGFRRDGMAKMMGTRPVLAALHRNGRLVPVSISICNLEIEHGQRVSVAVLHDVTMLNTHLDRATQLAETDALTGLGNRLRLSRRLQGLLDTDRPFAVLFLDLQNFKLFNDHHGHEAGDEALRIVGQRLLGQVRGDDVVSRLGGDEFVVLLDPMDDPAHLQERALAIHHAVTRPLSVDGAPGSLGVNIGAALRPRHGESERDLLAAADRAMYLAKRSGANYHLADDQ